MAITTNSSTKVNPLVRLRYPRQRIASWKGRI
jgi:hypothetical protein